MDMLALVGGEVRVLAGSGTRLPKASKSMLLMSGAMVACAIRSLDESMLKLEPSIVSSATRLPSRCCCGADVTGSRWAERESDSKRSRKSGG